MCRAAARASQLDQPLAPAVRGGRQGPAGGMGRDAHSFSPGQDALAKSPAAPHGLVGRSPTSAKRGCLFFWLLFFGQANKSNPASGRRSEARRRRARSPQHAIKRRPHNKALDPGRRRDDELSGLAVVMRQPNAKSPDDSFHTLPSKAPRARPTHGALALPTQRRQKPNELRPNLSPPHPTSQPKKTPHSPRNHRAASTAKYVRIASAPARLNAVSDSSTTAFSSSHPFCAAALSIAYSPLT